MNGKATREEIETFIENYNKTMEWNADIRRGFDENGSEELKDFLDEWLQTVKLTEKETDDKNFDTIETESSYISEDEYKGVKYFEMNAYSHNNYHNMYYSYRVMTEDEYKKQRFGLMMKEINKELGDTTEKINVLLKKKKEYEEIKIATELSRIRSMKSCDEFCNEIYRIANNEKDNMPNGYGWWIYGYALQNFGEEIANNAIKAYDCREDQRVIEEFLELCWLSIRNEEKL